MCNYIAKHKIGLSPDKRGPKPSLPPILLDMLQFYVSMCQLSGEDEIWPKQLQGIIGVVIASTYLGPV